jgi:hypothetical protein
MKIEEGAASSLSERLHEPHSYAIRVRNFPLGARVSEVD